MSRGLQLLPKGRPYFPVTSGKPASVHPAVPPLSAATSTNPISRSFCAARALDDSLPQSQLVTIACLRSNFSASTVTSVTADQLRSGDVSLLIPIRRTELPDQRRIGFSQPFLQLGRRDALDLIVRHDGSSRSSHDRPGGRRSGHRPGHQRGRRGRARVRQTREVRGDRRRCLLGRPRAGRARGQGEQQEAGCDHHEPNGSSHGELPMAQLAAWHEVAPSPALAARRAVVHHQRQPEPVAGRRRSDGRCRCLGLRRCWRGRLSRRLGHRRGQRRRLGGRLGRCLGHRRGQRRRLGGRLGRCLGRR